jgi:hypothetical protein
MLGSAGCPGPGLSPVTLVRTTGVRAAGEAIGDAMPVGEADAMSDALSLRAGPGVPPQAPKASRATTAVGHALESSSRPARNAISIPIQARSGR